MSKITVVKKAVFTGHREGVYALETAGEGAFFSAGADGLVARWQIDQPEQGQLVAQVGKSVYALCPLQGGQLLAIGQNFEGLHLVDVAQLQAVQSSQITRAAIFAVQQVGNCLAVGSGEGLLTVLDAERLGTVARLAFSDKSLRALALHPQGHELAAGYSDHQIRIIDTHTWQVKHTLSGHSNSVFALSYSPEGAYLLSGSRDAHLNVWQAEQGYALAQRIVAHMYTINHIAYSPDAAYFATCSKDKAIKLWDAASFRLLKVIDRARHAGHGTSVNRLLWTGPRQFLAASDDRSISLWEFETQ